MNTYAGKDPFIYASFAQEEASVVYPILEAMQRAGYRVWFNDGKLADNEADDVIAAHIDSCACFLAFLSVRYLASDACKDELDFAKDLGKDRALVYLDGVSLPMGMKMRMSRLPAVYREQKSVDALCAEICAVELLAVCKGSAPMNVTADYSDMAAVQTPDEITVEEVPDEITVEEVPASRFSTATYGTLEGISDGAYDEGIYTGELKKGMPCGKGMYTNRGCTYQGVWSFEDVECDEDDVELESTGYLHGSCTFNGEVCGTGTIKEGSWCFTIGWYGEDAPMECSHICLSPWCELCEAAECRFTTPNGDSFTGKYVKDGSHLNGVMRYKDGGVYNGDMFYDDDFDDNPYMRGGSKTIEEMDEIRNVRVKTSHIGYGKMAYANGDTFEGTWSYDKPYRGTYRSATGAVYEGGYDDDGNMHGKGVLRLPNGFVYEGFFENNKRNGKGILRSPDGCVYEGEFQNDCAHGQGKLYNPLVGTYVGGFAGGQFYGSGKLTYLNGYTVSTFNGQPMAF